ncbi:MAG: BrnT family toxin [Methylocystis sp.]
MKIEFDPAKQNWTAENRGLDMARANEIFSGKTLTVADDRRDYGEQRFITIGFLEARMVVLVWTPRVGARRIISLRKANEREQKIYASRF